MNPPKTKRNQLIAKLVHEYKVPIPHLADKIGLSRARVWQIAVKYGGPVKYHRGWNHGLGGWKRGCRCQVCVDERREANRRRYYRHHPPF